MQLNFECCSTSFQAFFAQSALKWTQAGVIMFVHLPASFLSSST